MTVRLLVASIFAIFLFSACDGEGPGTPTPTPTGTVPAPTATSTPEPPTPTVTPTPTAESATPTAQPSTPTPTATATATPHPSPTNVPVDATHPPGVTSGVATVDAAIAAIAAGDVSALRGLVAYTKVACRASPPQGFPQPPKCPPGTPDGTPVDIFAGASCEGFYILPDDVDEAVARFLDGRPGLYAVIESDPSAPAPVDWPAARYTIVYGVEHDVLDLLAQEVLIGEEGVAGILSGCSATPAQEIANIPADRWVLPPPVGSPAEAWYPPGMSSGVPEVDVVVGAALEGDAKALAALAAFEQIACVAVPQGLGGPPICPEGVADGTVVAVMRVAECEGTYFYREGIEGDLQRATRDLLGLYAVYQVPEDAPGSPFSPAGSYGAVFAAEFGGRLVGVTFVVQGASLAAINFGCGDTPERAVAWGEVDLILPPPPQ